MAGKFEIFAGKDGAFRFRLKAGNGETILVSEGYTRKTSARGGVDSVRRNAANPARFVRKETAGGFRFSLMSTNGKVVGTSESYASAAGRDKGIESVMRNAPEAALEDLTV